MNPKVTAEHRQRGALIYVRQSTPGQVIEHTESQRRQYALADTARGMGFLAVETIDEDLGRSGSGLVERPGFQRLVAAVCSGSVGAVFCLEASRLARNGRDWHHLIDLCALVGTLVVDGDGVYEPRLVNDRLLLGLKGTMSEYELSLLRQRGRAGAAPRRATPRRSAVSCASASRPATSGASAGGWSSTRTRGSSRPCASSSASSRSWAASDRSSGGRVPRRWRSR